MVLSEQTWGLVSLLVKAEQWDYLELMHECGPVGSDNLKGTDLEKGVVGVCMCLSWLGPTERSLLERQPNRHFGNCDSFGVVWPPYNPQIIFLKTFDGSF